MQIVRVFDRIDVWRYRDRALLESSNSGALARYQLGVHCRHTRVSVLRNCAFVDCMATAFIGFQGAGPYSLDWYF
jgi:hypothetical protein